MLFQIEVGGLTDVLRPFLEDTLGEGVEQLKQFLMFRQNAFAIVTFLRSRQTNHSP